MKLFVFLLNVSIFILAVSSASTSTWSSKIRPNLSNSLSTNPLAVENILVAFNGIQQVLAEARQTTANIGVRGQRNTLIFNALLSHSQQSQAEALELVKSLGIAENRVKSFWINNHLYIKGADKSIIQALSSLPSVTSIEKEAVTHLKRPIVEEAAGPREPGILAEWNIEKMGSHLVWEAPWGNNGTGVVVGFIDTGVRGTHEAIRDNYVNDGKAWRDPYNQYMVPTDVYNHGTHTVGSVVGRFGIGSAPDARWIACKGYQDDGGAELSAFTECGQFMVCPTDANGQNPDCFKTPHVTSNSWGVWPGSDYFEDVLDVWASVGIISLFSNGNEGPTCGDLLAPADSAKTMGVGATGRDDELASFSSRGPSLYNVHKPDISAPGVSIRSCDCNGDDRYASFSGTSMSCPNAAGVVTLMVGKNREITYDQVKAILERTAVTDTIPTTGQTCGSIPDTTFPNNHVGHGRINGYAAVEAV